MKKVLIIDDDEAILEAMKIAIEGEGYGVETLVNGDRVVDKVKTLKPDVILLDLLLSGKDGSEIAKELKSENGISKIPIIMISAHPSARDSAMISGVDHFLAKPFDLEDLFNAINKFIVS